MQPYRISGCTDGHAPAIILSSGLGGVGAYWRPQMAALEQSHRVLVYDQRGTGHNPERLTPDHSIADMADDVIAVMDDAGLSACHFVGHAVGGLIGLELARRAPGRVTSLVVVNGWEKIDPHTARCFAVRSDLLRACGIAAFARAQPIFLYPAHWLAGNAAIAEAEEARAIASFQGAGNWLQRVAAASIFDITEALPSMRTPTLVMAARDDVLVPYDRSEALAAQLPSATLHIADHGGHAMNVTTPAAFNETVLHFMRQHMAGS